ncbi:MAG: hypothetical protein K5981_00575 [Clostridia bacterium]|nr:hypothetical protein [Clostridia bacterium]
MDTYEMDRLEKVEQLVAKAGCSYAEAKEALEKSEWNVLDAIVLLESEGKAKASSASFSAGSAQQAPKAGTYVEPEVIRSEDAESIRPEGFGPGNGNTGYGNGRLGDDARYYGRKTGGAVKGFFAKAKEVLTENRMTIFSRSGNQVLRVPVWVLLILLILWFWATLITAAVMMVFGCSFHFEGRDFGKASVNDTMDRASQSMYDAGQRVKDEFFSKGEQKNGEGPDQQ